MMAAVMVRTLGELLQRCQGLLRLAEVARLQGIADLADGLRERPAALARRCLREGGISLLRRVEIAGSDGVDQLAKALLLARWRRKIC